MALYSIISYCSGIRIRIFFHTDLMIKKIRLWTLHRPDLIDRGRDKLELAKLPTHARWEIRGYHRRRFEICVPTYFDTMCSKFCKNVLCHKSQQVTYWVALFENVFSKNELFSCKHPNSFLEHCVCSCCTLVMIHPILKKIYCNSIFIHFNILFLKFFWNFKKFNNFGLFS